jgi:enoyl-CoA hydratase/carnithine racemase
VTSYFTIESRSAATILRLTSDDDTIRLTRACVLALTTAIYELQKQTLPLVITGNPRYFSVGADLNEIRQLSGRDALEFARLGQS